MSKDVVEPEAEMKVCRMRVAYWLSEDTREKKHSRAHAPTHTPHARTRAHTPTRTRVHTQIHINMQYLLLFRFNNGYTLYVHCLLN